MRSTFLASPRDACGLVRSVVLQNAMKQLDAVTLRRRNGSIGPLGKL